MQVCIYVMYMPVGICKLGLPVLKFPEQSQLFLRYEAQGSFAQILSHDPGAQRFLSEQEMGHTTSPPKTAAVQEEI